jgi:hypothetical protein
MCSGDTYFFLYVKFFLKRDSKMKNIAFKKTEEFYLILTGEIGTVNIRL